MNKEEMRIAIAEARGYKRRDHRTWWLPKPSPTFNESGEQVGLQEDCNKEGLPSYLSDLNAMHEAIMHQPPYVRVEIWKELLREFIHPETAFLSDAKDQAEAFCRTLYPERFK